MATKAKGLGRGLDALIPASSKETKAKEKKEKVVDNLVNITKIEPNKKQPRRKFDEDALLELADSIKQFGVLEPILVQNRDTYYEIISGERRWRAAKLAGLKEIPVIIMNLTEQEIAEISLIENLQREDLNPIEEAMAYKQLITEFHMKQDEIAEKVSKSRTAVTNSMRLLKLSDDVQQMIIEDMISTGHARALLAIEDPNVQYNTALKIFDEKLSVREVEKLVKNLSKKQKEKEEKEIDEGLLVIYEDISEKLKVSLGTKVNLVPKKNGAGKIEIEFFSHEELDRIVDLLK